MARCGCASATCTCRLQAGAGITLTGQGSLADPFVISVTGGLDCEAAQDCIGGSLGQGLLYVDGSNLIRAKLSADAGNTVVFGSDSGLYVSCEAVQDCIGGALGQGLAYNDGSNLISAKLSADAGNTVVFGSDSGLYVSCESIQDCIGGALGNGLVYDDAGNAIRARLSADANNGMSFGTDGGLYNIGRAALSPTAQQTVANSTAETVIATYTIPAGEAVAGGIYRLRVFGVASVTATPTFTLQARLGGLAGTIIGTIGPVTASSGVANKEFMAEVDLVCLTTGAGATWSGNVWAAQNVSVVGATGTIQQFNPDTTISRTSLASNDLVWTWTWSAASASNIARRQGVIGQRLA